MTLADTPIWVDHLRSGNGQLVALLQTGQVLAHPFVTGGLALGRLKRRSEILAALTGSGIDHVDVHLLASVRLTEDATLWTLDRRLRATADRLGMAMT